MNHIMLEAFVGLTLGWLIQRVFLDPEPQNPVRRITVASAEQNSVPRTKYADNHDEELMEIRDTSPAHFVTKINSFSLLSEYGIDKYETRDFVAGDFTWRLIIYPDGDGKEKGNNISVYLAMTETSSLPEDWEFNVTFAVFLCNQISGKYSCFRVNERCFNETTSKWGFPKLISKKMLTDQSSGYLVNDNIVLGAEVLVIKRHQVVETVKLLKPANNPQKRIFKIQDFFKLGKDVWISEEFTIANVKWQMKLYLDGDSSSRGRELSMELVCVSANSFDDHQKVKAEFCMCLKGRPNGVRSSGKLSHWFTSSDSTFVSFATPRHPKGGLLVDDCCTIEVEIFVQLIV